MLKLTWKAIAGFLNPFSTAFENVVDYVLDLLNGTVQKLDPKNKEKIQSALNIAMKVSNVLKMFAGLCPVKWQTAYSKTLEATDTLITSLEDLALTQGEIKGIISEFDEAVEAWKSPDDDTCID